MEVLTDLEIRALLDVGYGDGDGSGDGNGYGYGYGDGYGYGNGDGDGYGYGDGDGDGDGSGIAEIDGCKLYKIDGIPTAIVSIHAGVARGFTLTHNVERHPCFIAKDGGHFAHGDTLRDAFTALQEKLYDDRTEEERIAAFKAKFPSYDTPYPNADLFAFHHVLTGSCRMGREQFCQNRGISLDGTTTVRQFVALTSDSYGGEVVRKLPEAYGISED